MYEKPSIRLRSPSLRVRSVDIRRLAERRIVPALEKVDGVADADVYGGTLAAVMCRLDLDTIGELELPIMQILQVFSGENIDLPAGSITVDDRYMILRTLGEFSSIEDIGYVLVGHRNGVPIFLKDVAEISIGTFRQEEFVRAGGAEGVTIAVRRQPDSNTVQVNRALKQQLRSLEAELPPSAHLQIRSDQAVSVTASIGGVADAAWQGGLLAIIVLLFFLRNIRSTIIIAVVIPVSVVATFSLMDFAGLSMNIVSLMGITLGVGMFVDSSIVVLESAYRKQLIGLDPAEAARQGTAEVGRPIIASTLTTVSVFIPMFFVEGMAGLIFDDLSLTVSFALMVSLAVSLTLIPLFCAKFLRLDAIALGGAGDSAVVGSHDELSLADVEVHSRSALINRVAGWIQRTLKSLDNRYELIVIWALDHTVVVILSAVLLLAASVSSILLLGMEFLPETDEGEFAIYVETKVGTSFESTTRKVARMEQIIIDAVGDDLQTLASRIGSGGDFLDVGAVGSHLATLNVVLTNKDKRPDTIWEIMNDLDRRFQAVMVDTRIQMKVEGLGSLASSATGSSDPVVVELTGDDLDSLTDYARELEEIMSAVDGVRNVRVSHKTGKPELQFRIGRREALSLGLSPFEIAATLRAAYKGATVTRYTTDEDDYDVVIILSDKDRHPERFPSLYFVNNAGSKIPLENLVEIGEGTGPLAIKRQDRTRIVTVTGALTGERALNRVMADLERAVEDHGSPPFGVEFEYTGTSEQMSESFSDLFLALLLAVALVYMVMASQFESLLHPFIVMFSIPFAIIGLVAALLITGTTFSLLSFVGAIFLVGIVVNNAIVLIDYINILRSRGMPLRDAIIQGGKTRLKPILMTTITTIIGLLPMSLGLGTGAEIRAPMGRAVVGGLSTSTLVTLVLIPVIYWLIESKLKRSKTAESPVAATVEAH